MRRAVAAILWKDLKIELRTREAFSASFVFSVLVLVVFNFTLDIRSDESLRFGAGFLWVAFAFAGILALNRSFALEKEENGLQAMVLAPVDRASIYVGKFLANMLFLLVTEIIVLPLFAIFFNVAIGERFGLLLLILLLGTIGFSSVGTLFSAMAVHTRMREVILPVLLLPITVPVLIASVEATAFALGAQEAASFWFKLLIVYDVIFVTVSLLSFEYLLQE